MVQPLCDCAKGNNCERFGCCWLLAVLAVGSVVQCLHLSSVDMMLDDVDKVGM